MFIGLCVFVFVFVDRENEKHEKTVQCVMLRCL